MLQPVRAAVEQHEPHRVQFKLGSKVGLADVFTLAACRHPQYFTGHSKERLYYEEKLDADANCIGDFSWSSPRKRRTREHVIADLSVNHLERFILRCGWVPRRMNPDYETRDQLGWRFEHPSSETVFLFRPYRPTDRVFEHDLFLVRSQLNGRGLMTEEAFNESLTKTPA